MPKYEIEFMNCDGDPKVRIIKAPDEEEARREVEHDSSLFCIGIISSKKISD